MKRIIYNMLILCIFFVTFFCNPKMQINAIESDYTKKIISVVYDNSGSMNNEKDKYARYSLQILIGLLDSDDELIITPLNTSDGSAVTDESQCISVDLLNPNREEAIKKVKEQIPVTGKNTPSGPLDVALKHLTKRGLKTSDSSGDQNDGVEYWLIILSDGNFNNCDLNGVSYEIEKRIKDYSYLNTIYYSFGADSPDLKDTNVVKNYPVTSYRAATPEEITSQMMEIADKLTRRFSIKLDSSALGSNIVKLNLADYGITIKSICAAIQNSGAILKNIKYNGNNISNITKILKLDGATYNKKELLKDGCLLTISPTSPMDNGIIEMEFDKPIEQLEVMIEPAVYISPYFQVMNDNGLIDVDMQYINSTLKPGQKIKVQYKVYDQLSNKEISPEKLSEVFGETSTKVTYYGNQYVVGDDIVLVKGKNILSIDVQFKKNNFSVFTSMMCVIEEDPTFYRIESTKQISGDNTVTKSKIEYNIFVDNKKLSSKSEVEKFKITINSQKNDGSETACDYTINDDGTIVTELQFSINEFGSYNIICKVVSPEGISRTNKQTLDIMPDDFDLEVLTSEKLTITEFQLKENTTSIEFAIKSSGIEIPISDTLFTLKAEVNGYDITNKLQINGGKIIYIPSINTLSDFSAGTKKLKITVSNKVAGTKTAEYEFIITKTIYNVEKLDINNDDIDIYNLKNCHAYAKFRVTRDGVALSYDEIKTMYDNKKLNINYKKWGLMFILPYGIETSIENVSDQGIITCKVVCDMFSPLDNLLAAFISTNQKSIEVSYDDSIAIAQFTFKKVSIISRLIRILIIILIIALIIHIICYIIGFIIIPKFPRGVIVTVTCGVRTSMDVIPVNIGKKRIIKWHLKRLIPFCAFKRQAPFEDGTYGAFEINKQKEQVYRPYDEMSVYSASISSITETGAKVYDFIEQLKEVRTENEVYNLSLSRLATEDVVSLFRDANKTIDPEKAETFEVPSADGRVYVEVQTRNGNTRVRGMVFFVYNNY